MKRSRWPFFGEKNGVFFFFFFFPSLSHQFVASRGQLAASPSQLRSWDRTPQPQWHPPPSSLLNHPDRPAACSLHFRPAPCLLTPPKLGPAEAHLAQLHRHASPLRCQAAPYRVEAAAKTPQHRSLATQNPARQEALQTDQETPTTLGGLQQALVADFPPVRRNCIGPQNETSNYLCVPSGPGHRRNPPEP